MLVPVIYDSSKTSRVYWGHCAVRKSGKCSNFRFLMIWCYLYMNSDQRIPDLEDTYMNTENVILNFHENEIWKIPMKLSNSCKYLRKEWNFNGWYLAQSKDISFMKNLNIYGLEVFFRWFFLGHYIDICYYGKYGVCTF